MHEMGLELAHLPIVENSLYTVEVSRAQTLYKRYP